MSIDVFEVPLAPDDYDLSGKKIMAHDLSQPEDTSTLLIDPQSIADLLKKESGAAIYYADKRYTGVAGAFINDYSQNISAENPDYTTQLRKAVRGNILAPFPCPWSARNKALEDIEAGIIEKAFILVTGGNYWTVGSNEISKNGSEDGFSPNNGTTADIQFDADNFDLSSLLKDKISFYFQPQTELKFINSAYAIYLGYHKDTQNTGFESNIFGYGRFTQVYGELSGFNATLLYLDNAFATMKFEASYVCLQQWEGFFLANYKSVHINIAELFAADTICFHVASSSEGDKKSCCLTVKVGNAVIGNKQIPYPDSDDYWYFMAFNDLFSERKKIVTFDIDSLYYHGNDDGGLYYGGYNTNIQNLDFVFNVKHFTERIGKYRITAQGLFTLNYNRPTLFRNNNFEFNFGFADVQSRIFNSLVESDSQTMGNNTVSFNFKRLQKLDGETENLFFLRTTDDPISNMSKVNYNVQECLCAKGSIFVDFYPNNFRTCKNKITGNFIQKDASPLLLALTGGNLLLDNVNIITNKEVRAIMTEEGSGIKDIYFKDVHANWPLSNDINQLGEQVNVNSDLSNYM